MTSESYAAVEQASGVDRSCLLPLLRHSLPALLAACLCACASPGAASGDLEGGARAVAGSAPSGAALQILGEQQDAWNRGDLEGFLSGYWRSADATFSGVNGTLRGWETIRDRYRKRYPDLTAAGRLEFRDLEVVPLGPDAALVLGRWSLEGDRPQGGVFSVVFRRFAEGWRIVHDHTSASAPSS